MATRQGTTPDGRGPALPATPLYRLLHAALTPVVRWTMRPTVEGLANLPQSGPAIVCANHLSNVDPVVVPIVCPRPIFYLGKGEYFRGPSRWLFERLGVMPIAREGGSAGERSLARGEQLLRRRAWLGIFPEGTRSPDGCLHRGRTGAVRLAIRTRAPIVPVGIVGTREVLAPHGRVPHRHAVTVRFGRPVPDAVIPRDEDHDAVRTATDRVMHEIALLSGQTYVDEYAWRRGSGHTA